MKGITIRCALICVLFQLCAYGLYGQTVMDTEENLRPQKDYIIYLPADRLDSVPDFANLNRISVIYDVNRLMLRPNPDLDEVVATINNLKADSTANLAYVWIAGSSSPEGPLKRNQYLAVNRAEVLKQYLLKTTSLKPEEIRTIGLPEDWVTVVDELYRKHPPYTQRVVDMIRQTEDLQLLKSKLIRMEHSVIWSNLVRDIFPVSRNARVAIVCLLPPPEPPVPLISQPEPEPCQEIVAEPQPESEPVVDKQTYLFIAAKTNALHDLLLTSNVGVEVELWPHWSLDLPVWYSPYNITATRKIRLLATQPELRYWLRDAGRGHFLGVHTSVIGFNVALNDRGRYQDPNHAAWGLGLGYGFATHLDRAHCWGLEFNIGIGFINYKYDVYRNYHNGPKFDSGSGTYFGLTRCGITVSYQWHLERKNRGVCKW